MQSLFIRTGLEKAFIQFAKVTEYGAVITCTLQRLMKFGHGDDVITLC